MKRRQWPWLVAVALALAIGAGVMRFLYLERDLRREIGDELAGALEVARIEIESLSRTQSLDERAIDDKTFPALAVSHRIRESRTSLLARRGDSIIVLATASRDTVKLPTRAMAFAEAPAFIRKAFIAKKKTGGAGTGWTYEKVAYATIPLRDPDWMLLREVDGYSLAGRLVLPMTLDILFIASLLLFAFAWMRSQSHVSAMKREQELGRVRADFLAAVSHELRTPLAQIRMFADLLRNNSMRPEESRRALNVIEKESSRLGILVENLLNYANTSRGRKSEGVEHRSTADVKRDIQYVMDAFAPLALEKEAKMVSKIESVSQVIMDSQKLRQVLLNFLENAVKYGPRGQTITIGASESGGRVRISVEDQGPGVAEAERASIWKPFHRGSEGSRSKTVGSGIGLSVVRDVVTEYGGETWVESGSNGGARFVAELEAAS